MKKKRFNSFLMTLVLILSLFFNICSPIAIQEVMAYTTKGSTIGKFTEGEIYHGFKLIEQRCENNQGEVLRSFVHEKSGAKLFSVENKDLNKHFSISFRTPSYNNKGTAHILEHCVLVGGSQKYPVKQLLKEVLETSLSKNLNGMTTADTTIYPFSTTNEKEYSNIMDIYLDMVFNPSFYSEQRIFKEEGWYHEANENSVKYNGVVYNEMKGALSSPTGKLYNSICKSLYPNTTYSYIAGGDPESIPKLTFEELKEFHKNYYHPSNSYIFLYGDMNVLDKLKEIDKNYLSKYDNKEVNSEIKEELPFKNKKHVTFTYPALKNETDDNKSFLTYNFSVNDKSAELDLAFSMLNMMLLNDPNSLLVKNLRKAGFNNVSGNYINGQKQNFYSIIAGNCNENRSSEFEDIINKTLKDMCNKGIDKQIIQNAINTIDLNSRWSNGYTENTGSQYNKQILSRWIYDENPMDSFLKPTEFAKILTSLKKPYFENLIKKYLISNDHSSIMVLAPEKGLVESQKLKEKNELQNFKNSLTKDQFARLVDNTKELRAWFNTNSDEKDRNKIPRLELKDIDPKLDLAPLCRKKESEIPILYHPWDTRGTSQINLYFSTKGVKKEELPYLQLLCTLLGKVETTNYKIGDLYNKEMNLTTGISYGINSFSSYTNVDNINSQLKISALTLSDNTKETLNLIKEEISKSNYKNKDIMKKYIKSIKLQQDEMLYECPEVIAMNRNLSYYSKEAQYNDNLNGVQYINFINNLDKNFDKNYSDIIINLKQISKKVFKPNNLTVGLTCDRKGYTTFKECLPSFLKGLDNEQIKNENIKFEMSNKKEAYAQNVDVLYNVQGFNYKTLGYNYNGNMKVLKNILDLDYLWPKIRVKGGAYGINIINNCKGIMGIVSYRDPNLKATLDVYKGIPEYLENLSLTKKELDSYKISALAPYCHTKSLDEKIREADYMYFSNIKRQDLERELDEIRNTDINSLKKYGDMFRKGLNENNITVIGNSQEINKNRTIFNIIKKF